jgi:hypothetical protein
MNRHIHANMHIHTYLHIHIFTHMHTGTFTSKEIHAHIHAHRHTKRNECVTCIRYGTNSLLTMKPGVSFALTVLLPICLPNSETYRRERGKEGWRAGRD